MRIALDSVNHAAILNVVDQGHSTDGWMILGYANGPRSAWPTIGFAEFTQRGIQVAKIDVLGNAWKEAAILDVEKDDVQNPATITSWVRNRSQFRGDPIVYCNQSNLPMVVAAVSAAGVPCGIWLAKPTGVPPLDPAAAGVSLPVNLYLAAVQFTQNQTAGGGRVDVSMWFRDDWHPELADTGQAHARLVNQAYTLADPAGPAATGVPADPTESSPTPSTPPDPTPSAPSGPSPTPADADLSTPPDISTESAGSSTGAPAPDTAPTIMSETAADPQMASPEASPMPSTPTPPAPAGPSGVAGNEIENLIGMAKTGIGDLAGFLHSQAFHDAAHRLETAVGEAVQLAGLISKIPGL